jgi:hypothetical protein
MRKLDPASFRTMPWKNGGGTTTEILTIPPGASLDAFHARVSAARIERGGPFSVFAGVDRSLIVTSGEGVTLTRGDGGRTTLGVGDAPLEFRGEEPIVASLVGGAVADLGVMTRRELLRQRTRRVTLDSDASVRCAGAATVIITLSGDLTACSCQAQAVLARGDVVTLTPDDDPSVLHPAAPGAEVLLVELFATPGDAPPPSP